MRYITERALTEVETKERFEKILALNKGDELPGVFIVRDKITKVFCGLAKATRYTSQEIEIGYALLPKFWGKKLGTEMSMKMVDYGKQIPDTKYLIGIIDPENISSKKILEKCGLSFFTDKVINGLPGHIYRMSI